MMSEVMPSEKYSCSASLERLTNGSTATAGLRWLWVESFVEAVEGFWVEPVDAVFEISTELFSGVSVEEFSGAEAGSRLEF